MSGHIHVLSNSHSLVFLLNSRLGHFSAASSRRLPFSRSYRVILPSSLATDHSSSLVFSTSPPVSVCGTGCFNLMLRSFSRKSVYDIRIGRSLYILLSSTSLTVFPIKNLSTLLNVRPIGSYVFHSFVTPSQLNRYRNINRLSFGSPFRVVLRPRLTLIRLTLIRKPWSFGVRVSHPHYRYLCLHLLFLSLQQVSRLTFSAIRMLPYPRYCYHDTVSVVCFMPAYYPRTTARLVSCYALFE